VAQQEMIGQDILARQRGGMGHKRTNSLRFQPYPKPVKD
jgi:hypothetical protein